MERRQPVLLTTAAAIGRAPQAHHARAQSAKTALFAGGRRSRVRKMAAGHFSN
jgi:hypothetical protein